MTDTPKDPSDAVPFELDMSPQAFRQAGHELVDLLSDFYAQIGARPVTRAESVEQIRQVFEPRELPVTGEDGAALLRRFAPLLIEHSLHNGHPRFLGYITSSAAPLGALADLLAAAINQNCGLRELSPAAWEIEHQTIDWLAGLVGYPRPCGGIMVSGGNMANMLGFLAARQAKAPWPIRQTGLAGGEPLVVYASHGTHTWLDKAVDVAGLGSDAIRWVAADRDHRLDISGLEQAIKHDAARGARPFLVIATAGNVSTGAVDPLPDIADICARNGLWLHVDGAYGAPAAILDDAPADLAGLARADSLALDPHKWLYNPIEAACVLVRDRDALPKAFSHRVSYYRRSQSGTHAHADYHEHGLQNSRGFRALKTWLCLQQAGRDGYARRIRRDIALARLLHALVAAETRLEAGTQHLSMTTFRYRPTAHDSDDDGAISDAVNLRIIDGLMAAGNAFVSNAVLDGRQFLRACIVNFRTTEADIRALVAEVMRIGALVDSESAAGPVSLASEIRNPGQSL